ncbi:hypothetical protein [Raoultibacter phocaeensis]|uniref:hypothetical protein n=1 Tax=Raoultibacter phocaeensis TaxID=2479841 RepID=UPI001119CC6B|nr:hypothetical protein [Raoultibacter phocaeensis]
MSRFLSSQTAFSAQPYSTDACASQQTGPVRAKLRDTHGFALAEQLIGILFLGLLIVVIGAGLSAAMQAYRTANESTRANELLTRAVQEVGDELAFALSVKTVGDDPIYVSPTTKTPVKIGNAENGKGIALIAQTDAETQTSLAVDASPTTLLVASALDPIQASSTAGLTVSISNVAYSEDESASAKGIWTFTIEVRQNGQNRVLAATDMSVARIGNEHGL